MNSKQRGTLESVFANPVNGNLPWRQIESMLLALGATKDEGNGAGVSFFLNDKRLDVHRPHPHKEALKYRVRAVRDFLMNAGVTP